MLFCNSFIILVELTNEAKITLDTKLLEIENAKISQENLLTQNKSIEEEKKKLDESFLILNGQYEKFKFTIEQKKHSCSFRKKNSTSCEMLNSPSSTRYNRQKETRNMLEYIHGGLGGAVFGAWDFLRKNSFYPRSN